MLSSLTSTASCDLQNHSDIQWIYKKYTAKFGWINPWLQPNKCGQITNNNFSAFAGYHLTLKILFQSSSLLPACVFCFLMFITKPSRHLKTEAVEVRELLLLHCPACVSVLVLIMYLCLVSHPLWHWALQRAQAGTCGESHLITKEILCTYEKRCSTWFYFPVIASLSPVQRDIFSLFLWNCIFSAHDFLFNCS